MNPNPNNRDPKRRRVLCVSSNFPRWEGDSTTSFILNVVQDLQDRGWEVDVLAPHAPHAAYKETIGGVHITRFPYLFPASLETVCYGGGALINMRNSRSNLIKIPALVFAEWIYVFYQLVRHRYDLLHTHWILPQGFTGALAAKPLGIPHITSVHGGDIFALRGGLMRKFKKFTLVNADAVTVNSSATRKAVLEIAPDLGSLHTIHEGISEKSPDNSAVSDIRAKYRRNEGPLLVFLGRIVDEKGPEDFVRALKILESDLPDTSALIIGEGQDRKKIEALSAHLGLQNRITFTGWVDPDQVPYYLAAGDIFIGPSRTSPEGWVEAQGLTFAEAMFANTPVIATRTGGIEDLVEHGKTGMLAAERSPQEIADLVITLTRDPSLREKLVTGGRSVVQDGYTRNASADAFSKLFSTLVT